MSKVYKGYELMKLASEGKISLKQKASSLSLDYQECTIDFILKDSAFNVMDLDFELIEDEVDIDNTNLDKIIKVFEDIEMCLKRLSVKISSAGQGSIDNYLDRYEYDLQAVKQLNKEVKELSKRS